MDFQTHKSKKKSTEMTKKKENNYQQTNSSRKNMTYTNKRYCHFSLFGT